MVKKKFDPTEKWLEHGMRFFIFFYASFGVHRF